MQPFSQWRLAAAVTTGEQRDGGRERALPVWRDPSEGSFSSMVGLQRLLWVAVQRFPQWSAPQWDSVLAQTQRMAESLEKASAETVSVRAAMNVRT